jgi:diaminopimelate decarboxylase
MTDGGTVQGLSFADLASEFGTPLYVYDGDVLTRQYLGLRQRLDPAAEIFYSLKANPNPAVCALLNSLGARAEVCSLAELVAAQRAGVPAGDIIFVGPGKSTAELSACLDAGLYAIICESFGELAMIDALARERGLRPRVALRINPDFVVKGAKLTMGGRSRQFGIDIDQLLDAGNRLAGLTAVRIVGFQAYLGTRILSEPVIAENTERILEQADRLAAHLDVPLEFVDVGGGLGVAYFEGEKDIDAGLVADGINPAIRAFAARHPGTRIAVELGRYLTAPSGTYVVGVRYVKESMGERFAVVDGGTHQHMAAVGIGSYVKRNFPMRLLTGAGHDPEAPQTSWNVAGPLCTPNDVLGRRVELPELRPGDLIGVLRSGAYGPTASPGLFLSHGFPAEVLVHDGRAHLIRARDDIADILRGYQMPVRDGASDVLAGTFDHQAS